MTPLICFYEKNEYIWATQYELLSCTQQMNVNDFLSRIERDYFDSLKIVQINFEYDDSSHKQQAELYSSAKAHIFILQKFEIISINEVLNRIQGECSELVFKPLNSESWFKQQVGTIKKYIEAGRIYQVNLTMPLAADSAADPLLLFKKYFNNFNGNYSAVLPLGDTCLISFSPELFLEKRGSILKTQPIKGSAPATAESEQQLKKSQKEQAELSMIVDLLRNDLNKINSLNTDALNLKTSFNKSNEVSTQALPEMAQVTQHRSLMQLGYIQHTFSEVTINTNQTIANILDCTMPGGSISGCPKTESLKVINEIENFKRHAYTGTLGWWKNNEFCLNLSIRTFISTAKQTLYHAGCGIVYDSNPEEEWDEFLLKTGKLRLGDLS